MSLFPPYTGSLKNPSIDIFNNVYAGGSPLIDEERAFVGSYLGDDESVDAGDSTSVRR